VRCRRNIALGFAVMVLHACGSARRGEPLHEPVRLESDEQRRGEQVFFRFCHQCHPVGEAGLGPAINDKPVPHAMIKLQVRQGLGKMPAFSDQQIPGPDLDALVAYLDALKRADAPAR
jgi:mono/diheme cytochrome c family protein